MLYTLRLLLRRIGLILFLAKSVTFPFFTVYALYMLCMGRASLSNLILCCTMIFLTTLGITAGYHRLESHRSYRTHPLVRFFLLVVGAIAFEGSATYWVAAHLKHHAFSDKEGDPHSPIHGFFHSYCLWILTFDWKTAYAQYKKLFENDRLLLFFEDTYLMWVLLLPISCYFIGGWATVLWGFVVPVFVTNNSTYMVNSLGHLFGSRDFETDDNSRNSFWMALFTHGDGWHNNHHAFPRSAYHGLKWYQIDISGYFITLLETLGLASDVRHVTKEQMQKKNVAVR